MCSPRRTFTSTIPTTSILLPGYIMSPEIHTTSQPEIFVSSPRQKPPMNRHLTYRTQSSQIPADCVCEDADTSIALRIATKKNTTFAPSNNRV